LSIEDRNYFFVSELLVFFIGFFIVGMRLIASPQ